jgi:hypothetical protein
MDGSALKAVQCEYCSTEYLYVIEREASGVGTSVYSLNNEGAETHAFSAAEDTLKSVLENDFDPVPCPMCGHYKKFMFPKLLEGKGTGLQAATLAVILIGSLNAVVALYWSVEYLQRPNDHAIGNMVTAWAVLLLLCLVGLGLALIRRSRIRNFDPNLEDQHERIAIGRTRSVTRAEFEKHQQGKNEAIGK